MGGESTEAWRIASMTCIQRGLRRPEFLIVDGAPWARECDRGGFVRCSVERCTVHYAALRIMPTSVAKPAWEAVIAVKDAA